MKLVCEIKELLEKENFKQVLNLPFTNPYLYNRCFFISQMVLLAVSRK